jgi:RHS repeat-associated protein
LAQGCVALDSTCEDHRPEISISPTGGTFLDSQGLSVTITWRDDRGLVASSRSITVQTSTETVNVKDSLDYVAVSSLAATSSGEITLGPAGTTTTLTAEICDNASQCQEATAVYTYGGASQLPYGPAVVSLAPQAQGILTVSPYDVTASYSTAPYISQDVPRSVTLVYTSSQALAKAFVQVDALNNSTNPPTGMSITVRDPSTGANVAEAHYLARANYNRLAADWRATGISTGPRVYEVIVTSRWEVSRGAAKDTTIQSPAKQVTMLLLNDFGSAYGPGWNIAGLQRVITGANGAMITHGDGTAVFFTTGVNGFEAPVGEWSTLTQVGSEYIRAYPDSGKAVFSTSNGRLQYTQDRFGNRTSFVYDGSGRLSQVIGPVGDTTRLAYPGGLLASITDPGGRVTNIYYGGNGSTTEVVEIWDPAGRLALKTLYDGQHRLTTTLGQAAAQAVRHVYDAADRIAADSLPAVLANGTVQGPVVRYRSWELASRGGASVGSPAGAINPDTLHADVIDTRGYTTRSWLDAFRQPVRVIGPTGDTTTIVRNLDGTPAVVTSPSGAVTTYAWDGPRVVGTYQSDPDTYTDVESDPSTGLPSVVKSGGMRVTNRYGSRGQLLRSWIGNDSTHATVYTYASDSSYRVATITDPQGHQSVFTYQATGRRNLATASVPDANGNAQVTTYTYDTYGRPSSATGPVGTTSTTYDAINRATRVVNARNDTTWFALSGVDTVSTVTDAAHKTYTFNRNKLGWLLSEIDPNGRTRSYAYDLAGNITRSINRNSDTVNVTYDTLSRVRTRVADGMTTTFSYGVPRNFWTAAVNSSTNDTIRFDRLGRPVLEVSVIGGTRYARTSHFRSEGMRDTLTYTTPAGIRTVTYGFDTELRLQRLTGPGGTSDSTRVTYNSEGLPTAVRFPTGLMQNAGYFPSHALEWQAWSAGPVNQVFAREWTYDALNRVSTRTSGNQRRQYEYDAISQLIVKRDSTSSPGPLVCEDPLDPTTCTRPLVWQEDSVATYSYDRVHNRTDNGATLQTTSNRYATFGGYTLGYDNEGNLTSKTASGYSQTYTWNDLGQLASVTTNGTTVSYLYNGFGQRVKRTQSGAVTWSIYDGDDLLLELDGSGNVLREYTMYPGVDAPHSLRTWSGSTPGSANYYVMEQPGDVTGLVNSSSQVANQYRYTPWGVAESTSETVSQPLRFMARELDATTGLYYVRARWYDPALARFNSEDPIGLEGGINLYAFTGNAPVLVRDPTGLVPCKFYTVTIGPYPFLVLSNGCRELMEISWSERPIVWIRSGWDVDWWTMLWAAGLGKETRVLGMDDPNTRNMAGSIGVDKVRNAFCEKNRDRNELVPYVGAGIEFVNPAHPIRSANRFYNAGLNPTRQFVGSYNVDVYPGAGWSVNFVVTNRTSMSSLTGGALPSYSRDVHPQGGTVEQRFVWRESFAEACP